MARPQAHRSGTGSRPRRGPSRRSLLRSAAAVAAASLAAPYVITPSRVFAADPAGADGYIPLFDGKTLNGWHKNPQKIGHGTGGKWDVKEGAITGEPDPPNSGNGGVLLTDRKFGDFELLLEMNPDWSIDSGLFLRSNDKGQAIQMMVDYHDGGNVGHLYGEGLGGWSARPFSISGEIGYGGNLVALFAEPDKDFKPDYLVSTATGEQNACNDRGQQDEAGAREPQAARPRAAPAGRTAGAGRRTRRRRGGRRRHEDVVPVR